MIVSYDRDGDFRSRSPSPAADKVCIFIALRIKER